MIGKGLIVNSLNLLAMVSLRKIEVSDLMVSIYVSNLIAIEPDDFDRAIGHFYNCRLFPTPSELLEFISGNDFNEDWCAIASVARQSQTTATISGVSETALLKVTNARGVRSALLEIGRANDYQLDRYRQDWLKQIRGVDLSGLPPGRVEISLEVSRTEIEYPVDWDYSVRTDILIRKLENGEIKPTTARWIASSFPAAKNAEVERTFEKLGIVFSPAKIDSLKAIS